MRAIFLYGHMPTVTAAYRHIDALLRKHRTDDIALAMVAGVDAETAQALRIAGGQMWFCAPYDDQVADVDNLSDRQLIVASWHELVAKCEAGVGEFLGTPRGMPA